MRYSDFDLYKDLLREKAGLYIGADKTWLLDSRLGCIAAKWKYPSIATMTLALRGIPDPGLIKDVVEAMINHETAFFRHPEQYTRLREEILPYLVAARKATKKLRILSAGCGTGQEPYSLAMFLKDNDHLIGNLKPEIIAIDISSMALASAKAAEYTQSEVQHGLSVHQLLHYFDQKNGLWLLKKEIKSMVAFQYGNLRDNLSSLGEFDLIFCCNVLGEFSHDLQDKTLGALTRQLAKDGTLFTEPREMLAP